jgi:sarcosine oxidase, subunit delta
MALLVPCPNCGSRPFTEFWFGGELPPRPPMPGDEVNPATEVARIWYRRNVAGLQSERWYHFAGCRRWLTAQRDTSTNVVHGVDSL